MHMYERADCENPKHILLHFTICTSHVRERDSGRWRGGEGREYEWEREFTLSLMLGVSLLSVTSQ